MLFDSLVFGAFVGTLTDYVLGRFKVSDPVRLAIACVVAVVVGILVDTGHVTYF